MTRSSRLRRATVLLSALFLLATWLPAPPAVAEGEPAAGIPFLTSLESAFAKALADDRPLMICINSKHVDGGRREPAAKELRERTYKDARVVAKAKGFVCVFLTGESTADDFGELRLRYRVDGDVVSPQHIFAYPDGKLISRHEYWPHGQGDSSVKALLGLMDKALAKDRARRSTPPVEGGDAKPPADPEAPETFDDEPGMSPAPEDSEKRARWIEDQLAMVASVDEVVRRAALAALMEADKDGDVVARLLVLLAESKKRKDVQVDIVRAFGRPGLEIVREAVEDFLDHKEDALRANAAVSLEYIGSKESVPVLLKRAPREKEEAIANHMYRALGRCGVGEAKARKLLLKKAQGAKSHFASYGPIIGLAYFEKDAKAARGVGKLVKKEGIPGGGRRSWRGGGRRSLLVWTLTWVGFEDEKSVELLREDLIPSIPQNEWSDRIIDFYSAAADCCAGDAAARGEVTQGVAWTLGRSRGGRLMDDARSDRDSVDFVPRGEFGRGGP